MRDLGALIVPIAMLIVGWTCTRRPTWVVLLITGWLDQSSPTRQMNKSQKLAKYVREHPDTWTQQYPLVYRQVLITGFVAYVIFVGGVFIILVSWILG